MKGILDEKQLEKLSEFVDDNCIEDEQDSKHNIELIHEIKEHLKNIGQNYNDNHNTLMQKGAKKIKFEIEINSETKEQVDPIKTNIQNDNERFQCLTCGYKSFFKYNVTSHHKEKHSEDKQRIIGIGCDSCQIEKSHVQCDFIRVDGTDAKYMCEECEYGTRRNVNLNIHIRKVHTKEVRYYCYGCDYKNYFKNRVSSHVRSMNKDGTHRVVGIGCELCENREVHSLCSFETKRLSTEKANILPFVVQKSGNGRIIEYSCHECDYKSINKRYMSIHKNLHHSRHPISQENILKCNQCEFEHDKTMMISLHVRAIHNKELRFACSYCVYRTFIRDSIRKHIKRTHQGTDARLLILGCSQCEEGSFHTECHSLGKYTGNFDINLYKQGNFKVEKLKKHTTKFTCMFCSFNSSSTQKIVITHMKIQHPNNKLFSCDNCEYKCNWLPNLKVHKAAKHEGASFECEICGWKTAWKPPFYEHMRERHGIFKRNSKHKMDMELTETLCDLCGFKATSRKSMRLHKTSLCDFKDNIAANKYPETQGRTISPEWRVCTQCGYRAKNFYQLDTHKYETHRKGQTTCSACGVTFKNRFTFLIHKKRKHPINELKCDICEHKTASIQLLEIHKNTAHYNIYENCEMCDYKGPAKAQLHMHMMRKHKNQYLKCSNCMYIAESYLSLKTHRLQIHNQ